AAHVSAGRATSPRRAHGGAGRGAVRSRGAAGCAALPQPPPARRRGHRPRAGAGPHRGSADYGRMRRRMRRLGSALVVLTLASCKVVRDAFSAHPNAAGHAAGQTLTVERLADLAGRASEVPLGPEALTGLTTVYL